MRWGVLAGARGSGAAQTMDFLFILRNFFRRTFANICSWRQAVEAALWSIHVITKRNHTGGVNPKKRHSNNIQEHLRTAAFKP